MNRSLSQEERDERDEVDLCLECGESVSGTSAAPIRGPDCGPSGFAFVHDDCPGGDLPAGVVGGDAVTPIYESFYLKSFWHPLDLLSA
jgi:hypothetical protein